MASPASNGKRKRAEGHAAVCVLDYGSQYTQLICRRIRELSIYSLMLPGDVTLVRALKPRASSTVHFPRVARKAAVFRHLLRVPAAACVSGDPNEGH